MNVSKVTQDTYRLTVNQEDILFEGLWEVPNGVGMNSYIVQGDKTAIIDGAPESLFELLDELKVDPKSIDYLIINHMEPDHSGWIDDFKKVNSDFKVICSQKSADLLDAFFGHTENIIIADDDFSLDLGKGHLLKFATIPNVHWPDTMATFDTLTGTLFSCDAFGSFGKVGKDGYDDMLNQEEIDFYEKEAVRYYANIVAAFSLPVKKAIEKCATLPIKIIAPGHGVVWRENPGKIIDDYARYASYQQCTAKKEITLLWGSMYGMTEKAVDHTIKVLEDEGIKLHVHRVPQTDWGTILSSIWTSTGVIIAAPTYEYKLFPPMAAALDEIGKKKACNRKAFSFGSFGWSGGAQRELKEIMEKNRVNWEFLEPVEFKGRPLEEDLNLITERTKELVKQVNELVGEL